MEEARRKITIGFDISQTGPAKAGCGYAADGMIRQLAKSDHENSYILYSAVGDIYWDPDHAESTFHCDNPNFRRWAAPKTFESCREFWRNPGADFEKRIGSPTVFHANNFFCPRGLTRSKLIYTLHDLSFLENPDWTTEANRLGCFQGAFRASILADRIVAVSEFSRRHFLDLFPHCSADRVDVVYNASRFSSPQLPVRSERCQGLEPNRFWLSVGTIEPRKNHASLLDAIRILKSQGLNRMPLALAGGKGWLMDGFENHMHGLEPKRDVLATGYVSDAELRWLYENAFGFVYPSLFEGFGMPVLEAVTSGATVLCSNTTSLPEVAGPGALYFDPRSPEDIAAKMTLLLRGEVDRGALRSAALEHAKRFSWEISASRLLEIYAQVAASPGSHETSLARRSEVVA